MIVITDSEIERHVSFGAVCDAVERAFISLDKGESNLFDVTGGMVAGDGHYFAVKSGRDGAIPALGAKVGSYVPENPARGLPAHTSTTVLIDDTTGRPFALVEANYLNGMRTAAANALAVRHLARHDASALGLIGVGGQAEFEVEAVVSARPIRRVLATSLTGERHRRFAQRIQDRFGLDVEFADIEFVASNADVLVTTTPATDAIVRSEWVRPGTHVSAMGADGVGKQELDIELVANARLFVDWPAQAVSIGECQHALRAGCIDRAALDTMTIGRLLRGLEDGRLSDEEVTVFDSSGIAVQDIAAAHIAMQCVLSHRDAATHPVKSALEVT